MSSEELFTEKQRENEKQESVDHPRVFHRAYWLMRNAGANWIMEGNNISSATTEILLEDWKKRLEELDDWLRSRLT